MKKPDPNKGRITPRQLATLIHVSLPVVHMDLSEANCFTKPDEFLKAEEVMKVLRIHKLEYELLFGIFRPRLKP